MAADHRRARRPGVRAEDEDEMGKLQSSRSQHPSQRGTRQKPRECLEYIVVHEMVHLIEPTHNRRFVALMDRFMPRWPALRDSRNRLPVRHERWHY
jgi:hypothetical protein